jgi:hypothetical protein
MNNIDKITSAPKNVDLFITINVYKMPDFLDKQLASIATYVNCSYIVILNCNDDMFTALKDRSLPPNVYINPEIINKLHNHGSLTKGIVSNMHYINDLIKYKYCVVLSGRTFFYRPITPANLDALQKKWENIDQMILTQKGAFPDMNWHWPTFRNTLLAKHYLNAGFRLYGEAHEGLVFSYNVVQNILLFLNNNPIVRDNIFTYNVCVEEFALQTISQNEVSPVNLEYGFTYIGNGCYEVCDMNAPTKFTRKFLYR